MLSILHDTEFNNNMLIFCKHNVNEMLTKMIHLQVYGNLKLLNTNSDNKMT